MQKGTTCIYGEDTSIPIQALCASLLPAIRDGSRLRVITFKPSIISILRNSYNSSWKYGGWLGQDHCVVVVARCSEIHRRPPRLTCLHMQSYWQHAGPRAPVNLQCGEAPGRGAAHAMFFCSRQAMIRSPCHDPSSVTDEVFFFKIPKITHD